MVFGFWLASGRGARFLGFFRGRRFFLSSGVFFWLFGCRRVDWWFGNFFGVIGVFVF